MILSKERQPERLGLQRRRLEFEAADDRRSEDSSPCWSPDGQWICFATKINERRVLAKVPAGGGEVQRHPHRRRAESDRAGLVAGRQMDRVHVADGRVRHLRRAGGRQRAPRMLVRGRGPVVVAELADADFRAAHRRPLRVVCA